MTVKTHAEFSAKGGRVRNPNKGFGSDSPEKRQEMQKRSAEAYLKRSPEERSAFAAKGWVTRRKNREAKANGKTKEMDG